MTRTVRSRKKSYYFTWTNTVNRITTTVVVTYIILAGTTVSSTLITWNAQRCEMNGRTAPISQNYCNCKMFHKIQLRLQKVGAFATNQSVADGATQASVRHDELVHSSNLLHAGPINHGGQSKYTYRYRIESRYNNLIMQTVYRWTSPQDIGPVLPV